VGALWFAMIVAATVRGADAPPRPTAKATCERLAQPGRVRCEVEARVDAGASIRWGDLAITSVPPFATPLRGRVGPREATVRDDDVWRWAFAMVARERGAGEVEVRVRVVVCRGERCAPAEVVVKGRVVVGDG
jgi:hypothetical protein